jgi:hypothetical protein
MRCSIGLTEPRALSMSGVPRVGVWPRASDMITRQMPKISKAAAIKIAISSADEIPPPAVVVVGAATVTGPVVVFVCVLAGVVGNDNEGSVVDGLVAPLAYALAGRRNAPVSTAHAATVTHREREDRVSDRAFPSIAGI